MKQILDIVPNHMATNDSRNRWWWDVLEKGRASRFAAYFDIDWDPPEEKLARKILLPVLADHYGRVLEAGELRITTPGNFPVLLYHELELPLSQDSLLSFSTPDEVNSDYRQLHELLEQQHYRLAFWRTAFDDLNFRRFFSINDLVGLRMENNDAFEDAHTLVFEMANAGRLDGVRVDHADGLSDPQAYLDRLQSRLGGRYIAVEKILESTEELPTSWPVQGTTGYDFLNRVAALFVDRQSEAAFDSSTRASSESMQQPPPNAGTTRSC
ncbi:MAG: hypothetical protein M3454_01775 [Actinomycetota bacterium]|nr:hypothetical protein [Actinomycetota bacterium]